MKEEDRSLTDSKVSTSKQNDLASSWRGVIGRRSFLHAVGAAGAVLPAAKLFARDGDSDEDDSRLTKGDVALLRFAAAAEIIETDLWQQYNELGGAVDANNQPNSGNAPYITALSNLDADMSQYISDNTDDEISHAAFLNAYLTSKGADPVNFDRFRTLPSSKATGAHQGVGRLTNLTSLNVDTSWYFRYRSTQNPDLGATFPQLLTINNQPAIPLNDNYSQATIQAIANVAAIHFTYIEQGGSSLYPIFALKATSHQVLRILLSIGGVEIDHFSLWHDKMGNTVAKPVAPLFDPVTNLNFPDFNNAANQHNSGLSQADQRAGSELFQTNLILPEPCHFLNNDLPKVSIIRPTLTSKGGAVAAVNSFTADNLFKGQSKAFLDAFMDLAVAADSARRNIE